MTEDDAKRLGHDARLNRPSYAAAFDIVRAGIVKRLTETSVGEQAIILGEHAKLHLLMELDAAISEIIVNGDHAVATDSPGQ